MFMMNHILTCALTQAEAVLQVDMILASILYLSSCAIKTWHYALESPSHALAATRAL